jgi:transposase
MNRSFPDVVEAVAKVSGDFDPGATVFRNQEQWDGLLLTRPARVARRMISDVFDRSTRRNPRWTLFALGLISQKTFLWGGVDRSEKPVWRRKLNRGEWLDVLQRTAPLRAVIGMEACSSAHHWARRLQAVGYTVKLIAPQFVKPYVKSNKNDANDADAICEAMSRPGMRFVTIKTVEQQDVQAVHRVRAGLMEQRNAKANQIRGLTSEYGIVAPREILQLRRAVPVWLEDVSSGLSERFRRLLTGLWEDLRSLDDRIRELDREIAAIAASDPVARRLQQLRGVGPMVATALIATVGDARQFANGRQMAASLGYSMPALVHMAMLTIAPLRHCVSARPVSRLTVTPPNIAPHPGPPIAIVPVTGPLRGLLPRGLFDACPRASLHGDSRSSDAALSMNGSCSSRIRRCVLSANALALSSSAVSGFSPISRSPTLTVKSCYSCPIRSPLKTATHTRTSMSAP